MVASCLPHCRQSKRGNTGHLPGDKLGIGKAVVDVGFVSDPEHARILSWAGGRCVKAMIAPDAGRYKALLDNGQSAFNASTMSPFKPVRSEEEVRKGRLPLELPVRGWVLAGSAWPKYAVNMIDLPEDLVRHSPVFAPIWSALITHDLC